MVEKQTQDTQLITIFVPLLILCRRQWTKILHKLRATYGNPSSFYCKLTDQKRKE